MIGDDNEISDEGAKAIAEGLKINNTLTSINLQGSAYEYKAKYQMKEQKPLPKL